MFPFIHTTPLPCSRIRRSFGFTLVEIMIVVAIISLLAAIAVPNFMRARERSQATCILDEARMIDFAISQWAIEQSVAPNSQADPLTIASYLKIGTRLQEHMASNNLSSPTLSSVTFTLGTVGATRQVLVNGDSFNPLVVPVTFFSQFK